MNKSILLILPALLCAGCGTTKNSNIDSYDKLLVECRNNGDFNTELYIFPESTNIGTPKNFLYKTTADLLSGSYLLYLTMEYDEETFNQELTRLDKIEGHFHGEFVKKILHFEEHSLYLTISRDKRYEYAMYDKENRSIAYVSNQLYDWAFTSVNSKYILPKLTIPSEVDDGDNTYNMYYHYTYEPDGLGGELFVGEYVND